MTRILILFIFLLTPVTGWAQTQQEEDKGFLTNLIEDSLSGVSRDVTITGFQGALSSRATVQAISVADADGVWLTLEGLVLEWNRGALLRGAIDIQQITATQITIARPPTVEGAGPNPEASPFALPELPVSIALNTLAVDRVILGAAFLGEEVALSIAGSANLSGGEGMADITASRLDAQTGRFAINGSYSNQSRILGLNLDLTEDADGLVAGLLGLPGRPSIALKLQGDDPIDSFKAGISLATDGQDRVTGGFAIDRDDNGARYSLDLAGDVSPLFAPDYQGFFGSDARLQALVRRSPTGGTLVEKFALDAKAVSLTGAADIAADGWPRRLSIQGHIAQPGEDVVLLPVGGAKTYIKRMTLALDYDSIQSDEWRASIDITGFDRPGLYLNTIGLTGGGILGSGEGTAIGHLTGDVTYAATGLELDDVGLSDALGDTIAGAIRFQRDEGSPTEITEFTLTGPGIEFLADASIQGPSGRFESRSNILLRVKALERFSTLAGRDLSGAGDLAVSSTIGPLDGLFDVIISGTTQDLSIGIPQLDATLQGQGTIAAAASRDATGTRLDTLAIRTATAALTAKADIRSHRTTATASLSVSDSHRIEPRLSGPIQINIDLSRDGDGVADLTMSADALNATATAQIQVVPTQAGTTKNFDIAIDARDLRRFAEILGRDVSGAADLQIAGTLEADNVQFDADVIGETQNLQLSVPQLDPMLIGNGNLSGSIARRAADTFDISNLRLTTPKMALMADGRGSPTRLDGAEVTVSVHDMSVLGAGQKGQLDARLLAHRNDTNMTEVDLRVSGPDAEIMLDATVAPPDQSYLVTGDLSATIAQLENYRRLIGRPVSGRVAIEATGSLRPDLTALDATLTAQTGDLAIGNATIDKLLAGDGRLNASVKLTDGILAVPSLRLVLPNLTAAAAISGTGSQGSGTFNARLSDVGLVTDQLNGPVTARGSAAMNAAGDWTIDSTADGPGGIGARTSGVYRSDGTLNMDIKGTAPLGLANPMLEPRRLSGAAAIDLSIKGPPSLEAVSGTIQLSEARLAAPTLGNALSSIDGGVRLAGGQATVDVKAAVESGGQLSVNGPVALSGAFNAELAIQADSVVLRDPELYDTTVSGQLLATGPLRNGARITGQLNLGTTEVQVPSSGIGAFGSLPDVTHIGPSTSVRQTIARADAGPKPGTPNQTSGRAYPLDVVVNAPARIFVRGRGVDAELGGALRLSGTTADINPTGQFELIRGRINILQQRFDLTEGSAALQGNFVPFIRLVATTQAQTGTTVRIIVEGPATEPEVRFTSTPELPQDEVLSQLIFGRNLDSISPLQAVQLAAAVGTLAGRGGGGLVDTFRQGMGLDDFDVTTDQNGNAAVRAGKYVTENVYTDVTVSSDGSTDININLDLTDQFTAKGSVGIDGETSIGIFYEQDY